jgi:hypothetical protein
MRPSTLYGYTTPKNWCQTSEGLLFLFRKSLIEISRQINVSARAGWGRIGQWHLPVLQYTNARSIGYSLKATRHIPNYSLSITVEQQDVSNCHDAYYGQRFRQDKSTS